MHQMFLKGGIVDKQNKPKTNSIQKSSNGNEVTQEIRDYFFKGLTFVHFISVHVDERFNKLKLCTQKIHLYIINVVYTKYTTTILNILPSKLSAYQFITIVAIVLL